jgi:NADH dehydrogenase
VRGLREAPVEVTLVDRQNFHLFQPLVYQVATGALASAEVAAPLRAVLKQQANARVVMASAKGFDLGAREVVLGDLPDSEAERRLPYDTIVAGGSNYSYFGHEEWR